MNYKHARGFVSIFVVLMGCGLFAGCKRVHKDSVDKTPVAYPYRTIEKAHSKDLDAYVLHKSTNDDNSRFISYSAVIRTIDPAKDDYKAYCKNVITDIAKTSKTNNIHINIYDDNEAYLLGEQATGDHYKPLTTAETNIVYGHCIATYCGTNIDAAWDHTLRFYEDAGNGYYEKEYFEP